MDDSFSYGRANPKGGSSYRFSLECGLNNKHGYPTTGCRVVVLKLIVAKEVDAFILRPIENAMRESIVINLNDMLGRFNEQIVDAGNTVGMTPDEFNPTIMQMLANLSANVITPLAGVIFTILISYELVGLIMQKSSFGDVDPALFVKWGIKMVAGAFFLGYAFPIVNGIFSMGASVITAATSGSGGIGAEGNFLLQLMPWLVTVMGILVVIYGVLILGIGIAQDNGPERLKGIMALGGGLLVTIAGATITAVANLWVGARGANLDTGDPGLTFPIDDLITLVDALVFGELFNLMFVTTLMNLIMTLLGVAIPIVIIKRFMEIYLYASLAALPMATFVSNEFGQVGKNYLKTIAAYTFQGLLMIVLFHLFGALVIGVLSDALAQIDTSEGVQGFVSSLWMTVGFAAMLVITMFNTGQMVKSIFSVS